MPKQELSAVSMICLAVALGSVTTVSLSGCNPPTAVPRAKTSEPTSTASKTDSNSNSNWSNSTSNTTSNTTGGFTVEWASNTTGSSNVTGSNRTGSNTTVYAETPVAKVSSTQWATPKEPVAVQESSSADSEPVVQPADTVSEATPVAAVVPAATVAAVPATPEPGEKATTFVATEVETPETVIEAGKDWPQWGGTRLRNNAPNVSGLPQEWHIGKFDRRSGEWDNSRAKNIAWYANLGSQTYGNPVVSGGKVYVGTNNGAGYLKRYSPKVDLGCLIAFNEADGGFLWQHSSEKLISGRVHDWPLQGICCSPLVEGDRLWFVTSRGEVRCLDTEGFHDGENDGEVQGETARVANIPLAKPEGQSALDGLAKGELSESFLAAMKAANEEVSGDVQVETVTEGAVWKATGNFNGVERTFDISKAGVNLSIFKTLGVDDKRDADVIWVYNMMDDLGVSQHNMCSCSVTSFGDLLFVNTSNGLDESHINLPAPEAPTFICLNKNSGELLWTDASPGTNILHGQWSSPTVGVFAGVPQVVFAGGDGWVYSFQADGGEAGSGKLLWKFDANPKESKWILGGEGTRNNIIATPVVYNDLVYIGVGQDPEHSEGEGHFWCIDPTKRGDVSPQVVIKVEGDKRTPVPHKRIQAVDPELGESAVNNPNSAVVWHYSLSDQNGDGEIDFEEEMHRTIGTCAIKDDLVYIADFSGLLHCLDANGENGEAKVYFTYDMLAQSWGSPLIADGHVYVGDEDGDVAIFEFGAENKEPIEEINMGSSVYSTPIAANGRIYISTKDKLFAIEAGK